MTNNRLPTDRVEVAIFNTTTGRIQQVVHCNVAVLDQQHLGWRGHDFIEVTGQKISAAKHQIDVVTKKAIARQPALEELRINASNQIWEQHAQARKGLPDIALLTAKAFVGGATEKAALVAALAAHQAVDDKKATALSKIASAADSASLAQVASTSAIS